MDFQLLLTTFGAGFLTSLTPCVYPLIPISLGFLGSGQNQNNRLSVVMFSIGQTLVFAAFGLLAVSLGEVFGSFSQDPRLQIGVGSFFLILGYFSWKGQLPALFSKLQIGSGPNSKKIPRPVIALFAGASSALIASPCATPVLGGVLALVSQAKNQFSGALLMTAYGFGLSFIFLALGLGLVSAGKIPKSGRWLQVFHKISVAALILSGFYFTWKGVVGLRH